MKDFKKYLPSGSFLVMALCFLLPFFMVKCNSQTIVSVKGINLIGIGSPTSNLDNFGQKGEAQTSEKQEIYKTIIILTLVIILLLGFSVKNLIDNKNGKPLHYASDKIYFIGNIFIIVLLLIFSYDVKTNLLKSLNSSESGQDEMSKQMSKQMRESISVEMGTGFTFIFLLAIINSLFFANELKYFENLKRKFNKNNLENKNLDNNISLDENNKKAE